MDCGRKAAGNGNAAASWRRYLYQGGMAGCNFSGGASHTAGSGSGLMLL